MFNVFIKSMNNIKNVFNIKDLENLSGIKAHTIRIWEKRYNILEPMRTDTNIRYYDAHSLQKLLNISTLHDFGYKISVIAKMPEEKIPQLVREILGNKSLANHVLNNFKLSMMNFDRQLFLHTYDALLGEKPFRDIFYECFIPLLKDIGYLWQTGTITPAHEHFISYLIKQKIAANTEIIRQDGTRTEQTYVLYLPVNEIHEIGLMFINYELLLKGYNAIFLGESVPVSSLADVKNYFSNITFITYFTVAPAMESVNNYIDELKNSILNDDNTQLYLLGRNTKYILPDRMTGKVRIFESISDLIDLL